MMISVVVPTFNRMHQLKRTVESLIQQSYSPYEIVIVDDGSSDGTGELLQQYAGHKNIKYLRQENKGPAAARNTGIRNSCGNFILFIDDDCVAPQDWVYRYVQAFSSIEADIIGGAVKNCIKENIFSEVSQEISNHWVLFSNQSGMGSPVMTSNNIGYKREMLERIGGFDESFLSPGFEERALNFSILNSGGKSFFLSDLYVEHYHDLNFVKFIRQQFNYGKGAYLYYRVLPGKIGKRPRPMPCTAYVSLIRKFFIDGVRKGVPKVMVFLLAQFVGLCGYLIAFFLHKFR